MRVYQFYYFTITMLFLQSVSKNEIKTGSFSNANSLHLIDSKVQRSFVSHSISDARDKTLELGDVFTPFYSSFSPSIKNTSCIKTEKPKKYSKSYSCQYCGHKSSQKQSLTQHVQSVHERLKPFECKREG